MRVWPAVFFVEKIQKIFDFMISFQSETTLRLRGCKFDSRMSVKNAEPLCLAAAASQPRAREQLREGWITATEHRRQWWNLSVGEGDVEVIFG